MNILYRKKFAEDYSDEGNFRNFIEVCDSLGLPVFEVRRVKNPLRSRTVLLPLPYTTI